MPGAVLGTAGYMSPEQVRGEAVDARSDIFSFGLVLYECLAGRPPFERPTSVEVMTAILREDPPELPETVAPALRQIVVHCLEKEPDRRFHSARDLAFALRTVNLSAAGSRPSGQMPVVVERQRKWLWPGATCGLAVLLASSRFRIFSELEPIDLAGYRFTPFANDHEPEAEAAWRPDGKSIAYLKTIDGVPQLMVRALDSAVPDPTDQIAGSHLARLLVTRFDADLLHHPRRRGRTARHQPLGRAGQAHHGSLAQRRNLARRQDARHLAHHRIGGPVEKHGLDLFASGR